MPIKYSLSKDLSSPLDLNGATITPNTKIYAFYDQFLNVDAPYSFWDNSVKVGNNESQAPIEVGNGNGWTPAQGNHRLEIKNKSGTVLETVNFTVQAAEPPIPPNPTLKTITLKLKSDNSEIAKITYDETKCDLVNS